MLNMASVAWTVVILMSVMPARDVSRARDLERRASDLQRAGKYREAEKPLLEAIQLWKRYHGPNNIEVLNDEMNLAVSYRRRGDARLAIPILERVASGLKASDDPDASELYRKALNNLSAAYRASGRLKEARVSLEKCLQELERGGTSEERARVLDNLAGILLEEDAPELAEDFARRALEEWKGLRGDEDVDVGVSMSVVGTALMRQGKLEEARPLLEGALAITERLRGKEHPEVGAGLNLIAELEFRSGRRELARKLYERSLALSRKHLTEDHPQVQDAIHGLQNTPQ